MSDTSQATASMIPSRDSGARTEDQAELNMARLITLVGDVRRGRVTDIDFRPGALPRMALLKHVSVATAAASIGWSILGLAVWKAGRHLPSRSSLRFFSFETRAREQHIDRMIALARGDV